MRRPPTATPLATLSADADVTTVSLAATPAVAEGGSITYTATLDNPTETALSLTLSNGAVISSAAGASTGTASFTAADDVHVDAASNYTVSIAASSGGNFESLDTTATATTVISDDADVTTVTLAATPAVVEGGSFTYTAAHDNPAGKARTDALSTEPVINIAANGDRKSVV